MAKWGEGDPRWIVEERADATNVNNWHWYVMQIVYGQSKQAKQSKVVKKRVKADASIPIK